MSFNPPRFKKTKSSTATSHVGWVPTTKIPTTRRKYGTGHAVILPRVDLYTTEGTFQQEISTTASTADASSVDTPATASAFHGSPRKARSLSPKKRSHGSKVQAQYHVWTRSVIPAMLPVFLKLLRETNNLRDLSAACRHTCTCTATVHKLTVSLISFDGKPQHHDVHWSPS
jgi:hypothetical protein